MTLKGTDGASEHRAGTTLGESGYPSFKFGFINFETNILIVPVFSLSGHSAWNDRTGRSANSSPHFEIRTPAPPIQGPESVLEVKTKYPSGVKRVNSGEITSNQ